jgi:hypothetical protein
MRLIRRADKAVAFLAGFEPLFQAHQHQTHEVRTKGVGSLCLKPDGIKTPDPFLIPPDRANLFALDKSLLSLLLLQNGLTTFLKRDIPYNYAFSIT